jgi:hypothetical protein
MAAGDLITTDFELEFRDLLLGGDSAYSIVGITGLLDLPRISSADQQRLRRHGLHAADDFLLERSIVVTFEVYGADETAFTAAITNLRNALRPGIDEAPLVMQFPSICGGNKFRVNARVRRIDWPIGMEQLFRIPVMSVEFVSTDPRLFGNGLESTSASLPTAGGGMTFDLTFDLTFGATSTGGEITCINDGNFQAPVVFRIDGPVTTPRIIHNGLDKELKLNLTVASGDFILLDSESRTVLLNGTASRYSYLTSASSWFDLEPGTNQISFRGASIAAGSLTASWRDSWV